MADRFKKFFKKKKLDSKFKAAGPAYKLSDDSTSMSAGTSNDASQQPLPVKRSDLSDSAKLAAQAAIERNLKTKNKFGALSNRSLMSIKAQARKELESELAPEIDSKLHLDDAKGDRNVQKENLAVQDVYFQCPLVSNEILTKNDWKTKIEEFLYEKLNEESGMISCLIIQSCNGNNKLKISECIQTLTRYLDNIINNPEEPKFHRIRLANRVYQDKVQPIRGAFEFLQAAGFRKLEENGEEFLVYDSSDCDSETLPMLLDALQSAEPIPIDLDRNMQVLLPSQANNRTELPSSFFALSVEELKNEQKNRSETLEKNFQLRTKAMREKEELREIKKYKYSVIRVRFPDGVFLQGTFSIYENVDSILEFVRAALDNESLEFNLITTQIDRGTSIIQKDEYEMSLLQMKLVPASVLIFEPNNVEGGSMMTNMHFLKPDVMLMVNEI